MVITAEDGSYKTFSEGAKTIATFDSAGVDTGLIDVNFEVINNILSTIEWEALDNAASDDPFGDSVTINLDGSVTMNTPILSSTFAADTLVVTLEYADGTKSGPYSIQDQLAKILNIAGMLESGFYVGGLNGSID